MIESQITEYEASMQGRLRNNVPARMHAIDELILASENEENENHEESVRLLYLTAAGNSIKNTAKYDPTGSRTMDIRVRATEGLIQAGIVTIDSKEEELKESPFTTKYREKITVDPKKALDGLRLEMHLGGENLKDSVDLLAEIAMKHDDEEIRNIALGNLTTNITALRFGNRTRMPEEYSSEYIIKTLVNHREDKPIVQLTRDEKVNISFDIMSLVANGNLNHGRMMDMLNSQMTNEQILKKLEIHLGLLPNIQQLSHLRYSEFNIHTQDELLASSIESLLKFQYQEDLFAALTIMGKSLNDKEEIRNIILKGLVEEIEKKLEFDDDAINLINLFTSINDNFRTFVGNWEVAHKQFVRSQSEMDLVDGLLHRVNEHTERLVKAETHLGRYSLQTPKEPQE